jgi:hypothetical protein
MKMDSEQEIQEWENVMNDIMINSRSAGIDLNEPTSILVPDINFS